MFLIELVDDSLHKFRLFLYTCPNSVGMYDILAFCHNFITVLFSISTKRKKNITDVNCITCIKPLSLSLATIVDKFMFVFN